jgi:hypothetical protein
MTQTRSSPENPGRFILAESIVRESPTYRYFQPVAAIVERLENTREVRQPQEYRGHYPRG